MTPLTNLHSTMYLLNPAAQAKEKEIAKFTFHYVSIKSLNRMNDMGLEPNLHSTMYLLNPKCSK